MDDIEDRYALLEKFLRNGMNISQFHFQSDLDKENLFEMYKEYLLGLNNNERDIETVYDFDKNLIVMIGGLEYCTFEISSDYTTLSCHALYDIDDPNLVFLLTSFFLTLKELSEMIQKLSEVFKSVAPMKIKKETVSKTNISNSKYKSLPPSVLNSMNKIKKLQKSILSENKKYEYIPKGKNDD